MVTLSFTSPTMSPAEIAEILGHLPDETRNRGERIRPGAAPHRSNGLCYDVSLDSTEFGRAMDTVARRLTGLETGVALLGTRTTNLLRVSVCVEGDDSVTDVVPVDVLQWLARIRADLDLTVYDGRSDEVTSR